MGTVHVRDGDLFDDTPPGATMLHCCNAKGVWGSGIAWEFKKRYPQAFNEYKNACDGSIPSKMMGKSLLLNKHTNHPIAALMVSKDYGINKDRSAEILGNTEHAITDLFHKLRSFYGSDRRIPIYSPQINAGLFAVPWHETLSLIRKLVEPEENLMWTVFIARVAAGRS